MIFTESYEPVYKIFHFLVCRRIIKIFLKSRVTDLIEIHSSSQQKFKKKLVEDRGPTTYFINLLIKFPAEVNVTHWNSTSDAGVFMKWNLNIYLNIHLGKEKLARLRHSNMFFYSLYVQLCISNYLSKTIMYIFH